MVHLGTDCEENRHRSLYWCLCPLLENSPYCMCTAFVSLTIHENRKCSSILNFLGSTSWYGLLELKDLPFCKG